MRNSLRSSQLLRVWILEEEFAIQQLPYLQKVHFAVNSTEDNVGSSYFEWRKGNHHYHLALSRNLLEPIREIDHGLSMHYLL